ncbi:hypothetical protein PV350_41155 [Streptomyces sp. PA03-6a]|nr:hypothetical protein [Streptomyces sp. PA03-6a]
MDEIQAFLPLEIISVEADLDGVSLSGDRWRLRVNTNWQVSVDGVVIMSAPSLSGGDGNACDLEGLVGDELLSVAVHSRQVGEDLSFQTRAGRAFEIFSDFAYGEWIFSVWAVEDESRTPIFDLEGPIVPSAQ